MEARVAEAMAMDYEESLYSRLAKPCTSSCAPTPAKDVPLF